MYAKVYSFCLFYAFSPWSCALINIPASTCTQRHVQCTLQTIPDGHVTAMHSKAYNCCGYLHILCYHQIDLHSKLFCLSSVTCTVRVPCTFRNNVINITEPSLHGPHRLGLPSPAQRSIHRFKSLDLWVGPSTGWPCVRDPDNTRAGDVNLVLWGKHTQPYKTKLSI